MLVCALALPLTSCGSRNERYTYLVAPEVSDEQLGTLRARDTRMHVLTSADGSQRYLTSPTPVDQLGARVVPLSQRGSVDLPVSDQFLPGRIEGILNGLWR